MPGAIHTHRDLLIWQRGIELADSIDQVVSRLPAQERVRLADQMSRSARSVPTNIAEGHGRFSPADFRRFLTYAHGSLTELDTHLEIAKRRAYLDEAEWGRLNASIQELARMLRAFRAAVGRTGGQAPGRPQE